MSKWEANSQQRRSIKKTQGWPKLFNFRARRLIWDWDPVLTDSWDCLRKSDWNKDKLATLVHGVSWCQLC